MQKQHRICHFSVRGVLKGLTSPRSRKRKHWTRACLPLDGLYVRSQRGQINVLQSKTNKSRLWKTECEQKPLTMQLGKGGVQTLLLISTLTKARLHHFLPATIKCNTFDIGRGPKVALIPGPLTLTWKSSILSNGGILSLLWSLESTRRCICHKIPQIIQCVKGKGKI